MTDEREKINWSVMGPIYMEQVLALQRLINELNQTIDYLSKEK